jgi:hypothetical protein
MCTLHYIWSSTNKPFKWTETAAGLAIFNWSLITFEMVQVNYPFSLSTLIHWTADPSPWFQMLVSFRVKPFLCLTINVERITNAKSAVADPPQGWQGWPPWVSRGGAWYPWSLLCLRRLNGTVPWIDQFIDPSFPSMTARRCTGEDSRSGPERLG